MLGLKQITSIFDVVAKKADEARETIKAYHGSPHDFDRFSTDNIGTGEGAQTYGRGLYFAEREGTAQSYRDALRHLNSDPKIALKEAKINETFSDESLRSFIAALSDANDKSPSQIADNIQMMSREFRSIPKEKIIDAVSRYQDKVRGRMYEVDIDASPDELLDWDLPLRDQSPQVQKALSEIGMNDPYREKIYKEAIAKDGETYRGYGIQEYDGKYYLYEDNQIVPNSDNTGDLIFNNKRDAELELKSRIDTNPNTGSTGGQVYNSLVDIHGRDVVGKDIATNTLRESGIKGIKYADAQTRFSSEGKTHNYVIFDDKLINVAKNTD